MRRSKSQATTSPKRNWSFYAGRGCLVVFLCPFLACGLWATYYGYGYVRDAVASTHWSSVRGTIASAEVVARAASGQKRGSGTSRSYGASICYSYDVGGTLYTNDCVFFGDFRSDRSGHAEAQKSMYPVGKEVNVYYDPQDPARAVLEPGPKPATFVVLIFGLIFSAVSLVCIGVCLFAEGPDPDTMAASNGRPKLPP